VLVQVHHHLQQAARLRPLVKVTRVVIVRALAHEQVAAVRVRLVQTRQQIAAAQVETV
jgi:hypothetical protein